jgi:hypothetical protein
VAGDRLEQAASAAGGLRRNAAGGRGDTGGLLGTIKRVFTGPLPEPAGPGQTVATGDFTLAERLVEWRSRADRRGAVEVILALERGGSGPPRLCLRASISERGQRGKVSFQQIELAENDARAFADRLSAILRLGPRLTAEIHFENGRTALRGAWPGGRGPLELTIRVSGPRGGVKSCSIELERRQLESLAYELQQGLRRVRPN